MHSVAKAAAFGIVWAMTALAQPAPQFALRDT